MSRKCFICGKKARSGNTVSHSMNSTKRLFRPNLQKMNILINGKKTKEYVCTKCLKAGKVKKAL
ncbi:MAG: 50S ribosomal protein L28 [Candidatus Margulisbacteria bacterium]|nr:50S ribosomal protein L28 [Candidatus Margulisiibacteriota bacterium]